jgi:hypothetical protein
MLLLSPLTGRAQPEGENVPKAVPGVTLGLPTTEDPVPPRAPEVFATTEQMPDEPQPTAETFDIRLNLPGPQELFRPESEARFRARLLEEAKQRKIQLVFPREHPYTEAQEPIRDLPLQTKAFFPATVCFRPLYFDNDWTERYGLYTPCFQSFVSTGKFYWKTLTLPYHIVQQPPWMLECRDGY